MDHQKLNVCMDVPIPVDLTDLRGEILTEKNKIKAEMIGLSQLLFSIPKYRKDIKRVSDGVREYSEKHGDLPDHSKFSSDIALRFLEEYSRPRKFRPSYFSKIMFIVDEMCSSGSVDAAEAFDIVEAQFAKGGETIARLTSIDEFQLRASKSAR